MINENGVLVLEEGDEYPDLPRDLSTDVRVVSKFGFKVVEVDGESYWGAATEEELRAAEARRLGVRAEEVELHPWCYSTGPTSCAGNCPKPVHRCVRLYDPHTGIYYCRCR